MFVPRLTPKGARTRFDSSLYLRYREYRAVLGLAAFLADEARRWPPIVKAAGVKAE